MKKLHIKKGDTVYVNAGNDKGKTGKVLTVIPAKDRVIVEGVNVVSKHTKPNAKQPQGGIVKQEAGIHVSNVQLIDLHRTSRQEWATSSWTERKSATLRNQERRSSNYGKESYKQTG